MDTLDGVEVIAFRDATEWESWLADHHQLPGGVWLKIAKKNSGIASITITEALDGALCFGWIDSQRKSYDAEYYLQKYSRRRPQSPWSKVNVGKAEALIASGRMREPGFAEIRAAQADGRWDAAYQSARNATVPPDLATALEQNTAAKAVFDSLGRTDQYALMLRLMKARTPDNRATQLQRIIASLTTGHQERTVDQAVPFALRRPLSSAPSA